MAPRSLGNAFKDMTGIEDQASLAKSTLPDVSLPDAQPLPALAQQALTDQPLADLPAGPDAETAPQDTDALAGLADQLTALRSLSGLDASSTREMMERLDKVISTLQARLPDLTGFAPLPDLTADLKPGLAKAQAPSSAASAASTSFAALSAPSFANTTATHEGYASELQTYSTTLGTTINNLDDLVANLRDFADAVETVETIVSTVSDIGEAATELREAIDDQLTVLDLTKLAGPLKTPSKIFEDVLLALRPVVAKIEEAVDTLNGKQDTGKDGEEEDGEFLDDLENVLNAVQRSINGFANDLADQTEGLETTKHSVDQVLDALNFAVFPEFDALKDDVAQQFADRNAVTEPLGEMFNAVTEDINAVLDIINGAALSQILVEIGDFVEISDLVAQIAGPLSEAANALEPVEDVLDTVGAAVDLILGPVFEFLTSVLGIDKLLEEVTDELKKLLPDADFLQPLLDAAQDLMDSFRDVVDTGFGLDDLQTELEERLLGTSIGNADLGPTGFGTDGADTLEGDAGDDILDARGGRDVVYGHGGNDIFIAGGGFDDFDGGDGTDMVFFEGFFAEYELIREPGDDGRIIITHKEPGEGTQDEGATRIENIEYVVFRNITFLGEDLENAIIGGPIIIGNEDTDDLMFLNSLGSPGADGFYEAYGLSGNDTLFGSTQNDSLSGGTGNDVYLPGFGNDLVDDVAGLDTYQILEGSSSSPIRIDLIDGTVFGPEGSDTLIGVENLNIQQDGDHILEGDNGFNNIIGADGDDVISGRGGSDFLNGNAGKDIFITGSGKDAVLGGDGNDYIIADAAFVAGENELFIGGAGLDNLSYSSDTNLLRDILNPDSNTRNAVSAAVKELTGSSGSVRISAETGLVQKLDDTGAVIATDRTSEIETFIGSDSADTIWGGYGTQDQRLSVYGADGNDVIYSRGAKTVGGNKGDDTLVAVANDDGRISGTVFQGDEGHDVLDLTGLTNVRWWFDLEGSISRSVRAFDGDYAGNMRSSGTTLFSFNVDGVEEFLLADGAHLIENAPGGSSNRIFHTGAGNDEFITSGGFAVLHAGDGDDMAYFREGGSVFAGNGNDTVRYDDLGTENQGFGEAGNDYFHIERLRGHVDGGDGFDVLAFDLENTAGNSAGFVQVDLAAGTAYMEEKRNSNAFPFELVEGTVTGFEQVIGTEFGDTIKGAEIGEILVGREGGDLLEGRGGADTLFGGDSNDSLNGGDDKDRLHGGLGNDTLNGGDGTDTADYSNTAPDGLDGAIIAEGFGGVTVDLSIQRASGSFGNDTLISIENATGTANNDILRGSAVANVLVGGGGNDSVTGAAGDDVLIAGAGTNILEGGDDNDLLVVTTGVADIVNGGVGQDTLLLGVGSGQITVDFNTNTYSGMVDINSPVWLDDGTTTPRIFNGRALTPEDVRNANPFFATSAADLAIVLPGANDPLAEQFRISDAPSQTAMSGGFTGVEVVASSGAEVTLQLSLGVDRYDGTRSDNDILDLSAIALDYRLNIGTGSSNLALAAGDDLQGIDVVIGGTGRNEFIGDNNDNLLQGKGGGDKLRGAGGRDTLEGAAGRDLIEGGNGKDLLKGGDSADTLRGDVGDDTLRGGKGSDTLEGGDGNDDLDGGTGKDQISGGLGDDFIEGGDGSDNISGDAGSDTVFGGAGKDTILGGDDKDLILGEDDNDYLDGGGSGDTLEGGKGDDVLLGGAGRDSLKGGAQNDVLDGGGSHDTLVGGNGSDIFVFSSGDDIVKKFDANDDDEKIDLSGVASITGFSDLSTNHMIQVGSDVVIDDLNGNTMTLVNVALADLDSLDFMF